MVLGNGIASFIESSLHIQAISLSTPRPKPKHKYLTAESGDIIACQCPACQGKLKPVNQSGNIFTLTVPNCPECSQPMEVEKIEAWDGFTCHQCDRHISLGDLTSEK